MSTGSPRSDGGTWKRIPSQRWTTATSVAPAATSATASHGSTSRTTTSSVGGARAQHGEHRRDHAAHRRGEGREPEQACRPPLVALDPRAEPLDLLTEHEPLLDEPPAGRRQHHAATGASSRVAPTWRSSRFTCCETAEGVNPSWAAAPPTLPHRSTATSDSTAVRSIMQRSTEIRQEVIAGASRSTHARIDVVPPRHAALAVLVAVVWGANFVVIDLGLGDVPPTLFVAVRFVVVLCRPSGSCRARGCRGATW